MLKSLPKILTILFLSVFIFQLASLILIFTLPTPSQAADPATFKPQVEIPGTAAEFGAVDKTGGYAIPGSTASIAKYVRLIYKYAIGIVGILAAVVLMVGGVMWIVAGGSATAIGEAKAWIGASLTGLLLALMSYLILATVNPALVEFRITPITTVKTSPNDATKGCCQEDSSCSMVSASTCEGLGTWLPNNICSNNSCIQTSQLSANSPNDCKSQGGNVRDVVYQKDVDAPKKLCASDCTSGGQFISEKSFFIVAGEKNYMSGFCCICEKPENYCLGKGTDCMTIDQSGYCDGAGVCLTINGKAGEWCGAKGNFGTCITTGTIYCPTGKSHVWAGRDCITSYICCK